MTPGFVKLKTPVTLRRLISSATGRRSVRMVTLFGTLITRAYPAILVMKLRWERSSEMGMRRRSVRVCLGKVGARRSTMPLVRE
jgi:hypothetical protein